MTNPTPSEDWNPAQPAHLPRPTYAPAMLALGNTLLLWGLLTTWIISAVGAGLSALGLALWLADVIKEHREVEP
jgi:hypothetical protein